MNIGFGIIGCGMISRFHARALQEIPAAKLVACCSSRFQAAQEFANEFNCRACTSVEEMVARDDVHVITICTPSGVHLEPALLAAAAGKHLLIEKPLEINLERCDRLIEACAKANVRLATIFPARFHESWRTLKRAIDSGRFGRLVLGSAYVKWYRTQQYYDQGNWRGTWELDGGGALMNQAIHTIDLLQWLMGPVDSVSAIIATLAHERIEVEDVAVASLRFRNGALGSIEATTASFPGMPKRIEIHGDSGSAIVEEEVLKHWRFANSLNEDDVLRQKYSSTGKFMSGIGLACKYCVALVGAKLAHEAFWTIPLGFSHGKRNRFPALKDPLLPRTNVMLTTPASPR